MFFLVVWVLGVAVSTLVGFCSLGGWTSGGAVGGAVGGTAGEADGVGVGSENGGAPGFSVDRICLKGGRPFEVDGIGSIVGSPDDGGAGVLLLLLLVDRLLEVCRMEYMGRAVLAGGGEDIDKEAVTSVPGSVA